MQPTKKKENFKHIYKIGVRLYEVDILQIVNNAVFFSYFEQARMEYAKAAGLLPGKNIFSPDSVYYMVHNKINYLKPAFFDDDLNIYTRISYIKHSSFGFEHIVENALNGKILAEGGGVSVHVNPVKKKSAPLTDDFIEKVLAFEPEVKLLR